jgi:zinc-ribbon domain
MTDAGYQFCPRCGTALVAGHPFCPKCGFNIDELSRPATPTEQLGDDEDREPRAAGRDRRSSVTPIALGAAIIAAGLIGYALLSRPPAGQGTIAPPGASAGPGAPLASDGVAPVPSAPIVGLSIQHPEDGAAVATGEVTVIGLAPPGLKVTRDVSFGFDQHATADGSGHWAMAVRLNEGDNVLVFRIGDDRSTEQRLRVTFVPPPAQ